MAEIPGGSFMMGSNEGEANELPAHGSRVGPLCLDLTEVTVAAYAACPSCRRPDVGSLCNAPGQGKDDHPQNCVSWDDAVAYCAAAGKHLPTEAEWEFAARGGRRAFRWPWGTRSPTEESACWNRWEPDDRGTCAVGSFPEGAFGLKDMAGNVWEWVADWYGPFEPVPGGAPQKPGKGAGRVLRGGGWSSASPANLRGTSRAGTWPTNRDDYLGFRCAVRS
jgi:formylglycine-generating enzyme required for sulfatase activity